MARVTIRTFVFIALSAGGLGACANYEPYDPHGYLERRDSIELSAGDANAHNIAVQMVDPWPRASSNRNIAFNGQKMQTAVERYRTNQVTPPVSATTSSASYGAQGASTTAATPGSKP